MSHVSPSLQLSRLAMTNRVCGFRDVFYLLRAAVIGILLLLIGAATFGATAVSADDDVASESSYKLHGFDEAEQSAICRELRGEVAEINEAMRKDDGFDEEALERQFQECRQRVAKKHGLTLSQLDDVVEAVGKRRMDAAVKEAEEELARQPNPVRIGIVIVLNIPVYVLIGRIMYGSWDGFLEDLREISGNPVTPEEWWARLKLVIFTVWCFSMVAAELMLLDRLGF